MASAGTSNRAYLYGYHAEDFPVALDAYNRSLSLPIYSAMSEEAVHYVAQVVSDICRKFSR